MIIPVGFGSAFARLSLAGDNQEMGVTFGFEVDTPPFTQTDADSMSTLIGTFLRAIVSSQYRYEGAKISIGNDGGELIFDTIGGNGSGVQDSACLPQNCARLFRKQTAAGGRANKGRMYVPGCPEVDVDHAGVWTPAGITEGNSAGATFIASLAADGTPMRVLHESATLAPTPVTGLVQQSLLATQRRRLR